MKKSQTIILKTNSSSPCQNSPYKIIKVSQEEIQLSMKHACEEAEIIKEQNRTLINYQHKFIVKKHK